MTVAIVDNRISPRCERRLEMLGFRVLKASPSQRLSPPIASHPDMLMLAHGNTLISSADYCDECPALFSDIRELSPKTRIIFSSDAHRAQYPYDAIFNALIIGDKIFCKTDTVSESVIEYARENALRVIRVRQGYPACTTLAVGKDAAITADSGMARALRAEGITVTEIENGNIALPPYEYGFIGGAAGVFDGAVYFLGNPNRHTNAKKILSACEDASLEVIALSDEELCDLGKIIFLD